jgi:DNA-binding beta-propeller fold protein YncE
MTPRRVRAAFVAALNDTQGRLCTFGGRENLARSLGSVYACSVTLFLGSGFRSVVSSSVALKLCEYNIVTSIAVCASGTSVLVSDAHTGLIHELHVSNGALRKLVNANVAKPCRMKVPRLMSFAPNGALFVVDALDARINVFNPPQLDFHTVIGAGQLVRPHGVFADAAVVVVSEPTMKRLSVFGRSDGALLRRVGMGELLHPLGVCFTSTPGCVAVADAHRHRVSLYCISGAFIRHCGAGVLRGPVAVACSACNELIVSHYHAIAIFSPCGDLVKNIASEHIVVALAIHGVSVFTGCGVRDRYRYRREFTCCVYT